MHISSSFGQLFSTKKNNNLGALSSNQNNLSDTLNKKQKKTNDSIFIYYFTINDSTRNFLDSSIDIHHRSPLTSIWETDLGNFGTSSSSILFNPNLSSENKLGITSMNANVYKLSEIKFYNTTRPYSNLYYRIGTKQEQVIEVEHARNVNPFWNLSASYRKVGSPGSYQLQRTNNDNFSLSSNYNSKSRQYFLESALLYSKLQQDENGGVESEEFLSYTNYNNKRLVPVILDESTLAKNRSTMTNYYRDLSFNLKHHYYFGTKDSLLSADSTYKMYSFKPLFGIQHVLTASDAIYRFKDITPDSLYYQTVGDFSFTGDDSVYTNFRWGRITNSISLNGNISFKKKILQAEAGYGFEFDRIENFDLSRKYFNNFLFASIRKPVLQENVWLYNANIKFYFLGNLIGNSNLSLEAGRLLGKDLGSIQVGLDQSIQNSPFMFTEFNSNYYTLKNSFQKVSITKLKLLYENKTYNADAELNYFLLTNYIYRDTTLRAKQYSKLLPLTQLKLFKRLQIKRFVIDNTLLLQALPSNPALHIPLFGSLSRIAYENKVLKNKLTIATGTEFRYNTPFYTDNYSPLLYSFVSQDARKISNIPRVSYFFNFKVKTYKASISFDELQQLFAPNNINYSYYPGQNFMFRFGFHWMFVN